MSNRRKIRETVMQAMYALTVGDLSLEHVLDTIVKPEFREDTFGRDFAERLFLRTSDNRERTDQIIRDHIANWEIERLATVDRIILQMAITEILTFEDIPTKVSINEAIEIAKKYSTSRSGPFVNGILDAVVLTLQNEGELKKEGRGLVDIPARKKKSGVKDDEETASDDENMTDPDAMMDQATGPGRDPEKTPKKPRIKRPPNKKKP
ncbi:MAG: transcription antitermination factor NusB [Balneolaceae bacterium]|nr:MAG: transcription antitermination factor NusB [Balneolaceae bacterium]